MSSKRLYFLDAEYDDDGSDIRYACKCAFPFCFENSVGCVDDSVGRVHGRCSGFFPIRIESNCDVVPLVVFIPIGLESKGGQLIELFWRPKSWFYLQICKSGL